MKFKKVFYLLAALLVALLVFTLVQRPPLMWWYVGAEVLALAFVEVMYVALVRPVSAIILGMDMLKGQDFSSRLAKVGQLDAEKLVDLFNNMMTQIKEERIHRQEQNFFMEKLIDASPMGILTLDFEGRIAQANPEAVKMLETTSYDDLRDRKLTALDSQIARSLARLDENEARTVRLADTKIFRCSSLSFLESGMKRRFYLIESLTEEVMKAEKTAYEKVIRMIAHEVNNTVAGVCSLLEAMSTVLSATDDELAEAISSCRERIGSLNSFISSYANLVRIPPLYLTAMDLNQQLRTNMPFLESIGATRGVKLRADLCERPVPVAIDRVLFEQVLVNIVKNAVESIGSDGEVTITTAPGRLVITDNGPGITDEVARHLFSPFYSTKPDGQGLGLMFVSEVLRRHGFRFSLSTSPATRLTSFAILF